MLTKFISYIHYQVLKHLKPEIIGNPKRVSKNSGKNVGISNTTHISNSGNNLEIGNNVFIGHFNYIDAFNDKLTIEDNVQITNYTQILTHSTHNSLRFSKIEHIGLEALKKLNNIACVKIGEGSYIGPHSVIMPGTVIGKKSIVSAFSYVKGNFPDYSVIRGIPGKVVGDTREIDKAILDEIQNLNY
jgi:acetyltransferase-like isoleucine patch superfamily enzyme